MLACHIRGVMFALLSFLDISYSKNLNFKVIQIQLHDWPLGGIFASQVIRLIGNIYSQTMHIYICGKRLLSYQSEHNFA
jgi:hypothetical protein